MARARARFGLVMGIGAGLVAAPGGAEEVPLGLGQALELAGRQNPELLAARERTAAQAERAEATRRLAWPRLAVASSWSRTDNPSTVFAHKLNAGEFRQDDFAIDRLNAPDAISHLTTVLSVEAPLDAFGKVRAQTAAQSAYAGAADAAARELQQHVRLRVVEAYRRAALARRAVAVTEGAVVGARAREADFDARVAEGAALPADLLRARARRRQREAELAERRGEASVSTAALARLLGAPPGTRYEPTEAPPPPGPLEGDEAVATTRALSRRASVEAARRRSEAALQAERSERRALLPDLALWGRFQDDRNAFSGGGQSGAAGVLLSWGAFDPARGRRVAAAQAESRAAELETAAAKDQVRLEVEMAWRRAQAARERYRAEAGGAEEGREALRVVQERRQAGMATLTDELETEAASLAAELGEIRAATEAAIADAALKRAAGEL